MINTTLPVLEKELDEQAGKIVVTKRTIKVKIDTSVLAEKRWEENFPHNAKTETLFNYVERIQKAGVMDAAHVLSGLKAIYCFIVSDEIENYDAFLQLFDLADTEYLKELVNKIKFVFNIALSTATTDAKNS
ncbi:MAG: hypothetical protein NC131_17865 [Roseburia sp.]|nr:hypothetical protein [Roseburia sp.]